jgi:hypothetical protein
MVASHGDNFPSGVHGDGLQAIAAYFQQRSCRSCSLPYTSEGIELVRQEPGVVVVKVGCSNCGQPLGIALVGVNSPAQPSTCVHGRPKSRSESRPADWSKKDVERFSKKPKISYDDVLEAHEFFQSLGADWAKHLPKNASKRST